jgi:hypothetical protein
MAELATEADLARARIDPEFRRQMMAQSLELLIAALHRARRGAYRPETVRQIQEGTDLAVELADRLQHIYEGDPQAA